MAAIDAISSNHALAAALVLYPVLFRLLSPFDARRAARFASSREAISAAHCVLVTLASVYELRRQHDKWAGQSQSQSQSQSNNQTRDVGAGLAIIETRSALGNAIVAYELGYLMQDFALLVLGARQQPTDARSRSLMAKNINWRVLGWHHLGVGSALGLFHVRALRGDAKGVLIVLMFFLMNLSTPAGSLHWYLVNFHRSRTAAIWMAHLAYLASYGLSRVYLIYWIMRVFGACSGRSAFGAFSALPLQCRIGTGAIALNNTLWLLAGVGKFARRYLALAKSKAD